MTGNATDEGALDGVLQTYAKGGLLVGEVLEHKDFKVQLNIDCRRYDFKTFDGRYSVEDLAQDSRVKTWKFLERRRLAADVPNATELFCMLFFIVRNHYLSMIRLNKKPANHGWMRSDESIDELQIAAPKEHNDDAKYLRRFLKFIKEYDDKHQRVIKLWLRNVPYRDTAKKEGISHGTARNWVEQAISSFRQSLDVANRTRPIRKARKRSTSNKVSSTSSISRHPLEGGGNEHNST